MYRSYLVLVFYLVTNAWIQFYSYSNNKTFKSLVQLMLSYKNYIYIYNDCCVPPYPCPVLKSNCPIPCQCNVRVRVHASQLYSKIIHKHKNTHTDRETHAHAHAHTHIYKDISSKHTTLCESHERKPLKSNISLIHPLDINISTCLPCLKIYRENRGWVDLLTYNILFFGQNSSPG